MMQVFYTTKGDGLGENQNIKLIRNEFDLTTGNSGGWDNMQEWYEWSFPMAAECTEYYIPDGNTKEIKKYMYLLYFDGGEKQVQVHQTDSDILKLIGHVTEIAPTSVMKELCNIKTATLM